MRDEDLYGYVFFILAVIVYIMIGYDSTFGRFLNGISLGCFIKSMYLQLKGR